MFLFQLKRENINLTNELEQMKIRNNSYDEEVTILKHSLTETTKNHEDNIKMLELAKKELEEVII